MVTFHCTGITCIDAFLKILMCNNLLVLNEYDGFLPIGDLIVKAARQPSRNCLLSC